MTTMTIDTTTIDTTTIDTAAIEEWAATSLHGTHIAGGCGQTPAEAARERELWAALSSSERGLVWRTTDDLEKELIEWARAQSPEDRRYLSGPETGALPLLYSVMQSDPCMRLLGVEELHYLAAIEWPECGL